MPILYEDVNVLSATCVGFECNKCKTKFDLNDSLDIQEKLHWSNICGYGSVWGDGNIVEVTLCQDCAFELLKDFVIINP